MTKLRLKEASQPHLHGAQEPWPSLWKVNGETEHEKGEKKIIPFPTRTATNPSRPKPVSTGPRPSFLTYSQTKPYWAAAQDLLPAPSTAGLCPLSQSTLGRPAKIELTHSNPLSLWGQAVVLSLYGGGGRPGGMDCLCCSYHIIQHV